MLKNTFFCLSTAVLSYIFAAIFGERYALLKGNSVNAEAVPATVSPHDVSVISLSHFQELKGRCHRDKPGDLPDIDKSNFRDKSEMCDSHLHV